MVSFLFVFLGENMDFEAYMEYSSKYSNSIIVCYQNNESELFSKIYLRIFKEKRMWSDKEMELQGAKNAKKYIIVLIL